MSDKKSFNINDYVYVKLSDKGYGYLASNNNSYESQIPNWEKRDSEYYKNKADNNGFTKFQMWDFISIFGKLSSLSLPDYFSTEILFNGKDIKDIRI